MPSRPERKRLAIFESRNVTEIERKYDDFCNEEGVRCAEMSLSAFRLNQPRPITEPPDVLYLAVSYTVDEE